MNDDRSRIRRTLPIWLANSGRSLNRHMYGEQRSGTDSLQGVAQQLRKMPAPMRDLQAGKKKPVRMYRTGFPWNRNRKRCPTPALPPSNAMWRNRADIPLYGSGAGSTRYPPTGWRTESSYALSDTHPVSQNPTLRAMPWTTNAAEALLPRHKVCGTGIAMFDRWKTAPKREGPVARPHVDTILIGAGRSALVSALAQTDRDPADVEAVPRDVDALPATVHLHRHRRGEQIPGDGKLHTRAAEPAGDGPGG